MSRSGGTPAKRKRRKGTKALLLLALILALPPLFGTRGHQSDYCPICGQESSYDYLQLYGLTFRSNPKQMGACLTTEHRPFLKWTTSEGLVLLSTFHADGTANFWYPHYRTVLGPWLRKAPQGADQLLVIRALQQATSDQIDEILSPENPLKATDLAPWAKRILRLPDR